MERSTITVTGMSCATCSGNVEDALGDRSGVTNVDVNFATDEATVEYDPDEIDLATIYETIEQTGYEPDSTTATVEIAGMSCATCSGNVEDAVGDLPGVLAVDVNFATDEGTVEFNPHDTSLSAIYEAVEAAGYEPDRHEDDDDPDLTEERESAVERELAEKRKWVILGGIMTAPFLAVMVQMFTTDFLPGWFDWVEFVLATALMATLGRHFIEGAYKAAVTNHQANMDTLVTAGTTAGYIYSTAVLLGAIAGGLYYEAVAFILWFIYVGVWLEVRSKARASGALRELLEMQAEEATLVRGGSDDPTSGDTHSNGDSSTESDDPTDGEEVQVPLSAVEVGDIMKIRPGERIPTDGIVVKGESAVDESMVTGESVPVGKGPDDEVIGSTINEQGVLYVEATKVGEETAIQQIVKRVKEAQARQPEVQRLVDRVSAYFVPAVIVNALAWSILWGLFPDQLYTVVTGLPLWEPVGGGPLGLEAGGVPVLEFSMIVLASAILIACPCALGLATPMATMVGSTISAKNGVLFKGGDVLEKARGIDVVVFDKTGTLTHGEMKLTDAIPAAAARNNAEVPDGGMVAAEEDDISEADLLSVAGSAESGSEHPLARAIVEGAQERDLGLEEPLAFENIPGHGIRAMVPAGEVLIGNRKLMRNNGLDPAPFGPTMEELERAGKTAMLVALDRSAAGGEIRDEGAFDGAIIGVVANADTVRESARETVAALRERGLAVMMLTGDNKRTGRAIGEQLDIPPENVHAEVLPEDKADEIDAIQADGDRAIMVGDGVNDAPALTTAHVGVAIGSGTDVAIESADVTLMRNDPADVLKAMRIANGTISKVRQNLFWAFVYNSVLIPVASIGLLNPALAGIAMAFSSVSVVSNSLAFMKWDPHQDYVFLPFRPITWALSR